VIVVVLARVMRRMLNWILSLGFVWNLSKQGTVWNGLELLFLIVRKAGFGTFCR
jgi:hypothetical protein